MHGRGSGSGIPSRGRTPHGGQAGTGKAGKASGGIPGRGRTHGVPLLAAQRAIGGPGSLGELHAGESVCVCVCMCVYVCVCLCLCLSLCLCEWAGGSYVYEPACNFTGSKPVCKQHGPLCLARTAARAKEPVGTTADSAAQDKTA